MERNQERTFERERFWYDEVSYIEITLQKFACYNVFHPIFSVVSWNDSIPHVSSPSSFFQVVLNDS